MPQKGREILRRHDVAEYAAVAFKKPFDREATIFHQPLRRLFPESEPGFIVRNHFAGEPQPISKLEHLVFQLLDLPILKRDFLSQQPHRHRIERHPLGHSRARAFKSSSVVMPPSIHGAATYDNRTSKSTRPSLGRLGLPARLLRRQRLLRGNIERPAL